MAQLLLGQPPLFLQFLPLSLGVEDLLPYDLQRVLRHHLHLPGGGGDRNPLPGNGPLLDGVDQLVGRHGGVKAPRAEVDVPAHGVGLGADAARGLLRVRAGVEAHRGKVRAQLCAQSGFHLRRRGGPLGQLAQLVRLLLGGGDLPGAEALHFCGHGRLQIPPGGAVRGKRRVGNGGESRRLFCSGRPPFPAGGCVPSDSLMVHSDHSCLCPPSGAPGAGRPVGVVSRGMTLF